MYRRIRADVTVLFNSTHVRHFRGESVSVINTSCVSLGRLSDLCGGFVSVGKDFFTPCIST